MKRNVKFDKSLIFLSLIILVVAASAVLIYLQVRTDKVQEDIKAGRPIHILFTVSSGDNLLFSEVLFYNSGTGKGSLFDVPGNVGSIIEDLERIDRIDTIFAKGKENEYKAKIEEILDAVIPYYVSIDLDQLVGIVDILEGLELFIANPVELLDSEPQILLPSGSLMLDGDKISTFLAYQAEGETDADRAGRYQRTLRSLLKRMGEMSTYAVGQSVFPHIISRMQTNMTRQAVQSFILELPNLDVERIVFQRVHGAKRSVDGNVLLFPHIDGKLLRETVRQIVDSLADTRIVSADELTTTVEILNGTAVSGLASRTSQIFESFGYDVARIGNAEKTDYEATMVIARTGDLAAAKKIAAVIQCKRVSAVQQDVGVPGAAGLGEVIDVTIVLGKDFDGRYCKE